MKYLQPFGSFMNESSQESKIEKVYRLRDKIVDLKKQIRQLPAIFETEEEKAEFKSLNSRLKESEMELASIQLVFAKGEISPVQFAELQNIQKTYGHTQKDDTNYMM